MVQEKTICVVCAWRQDCRKKFLRAQDASLKCPDFTKDVSIKEGVEPDVEKEDSTDHR